MSVPVFQVDAFASRPFGGNPAGVCLLEKAATAEWMQHVAAEMNVAETAAALGVNENIVKVRLHRARMMLQKSLAPYLKKTTAPERKGFWGRMPWS